MADGLKRRWAKRSVVRAAVATAFAASLWAAPASAALLTGATISFDYQYPTLGDSYENTAYSATSFLVGAGEEARVTVEGAYTIKVNFSDSRLRLDFDVITPYAGGTLGGSGFDGLVFGGPAFSQVTGITVDASTNMAGFAAPTNARIVGTDLLIDFSGLSFDGGTQVVLDFSPASAVPEISTWAMFILGFGAIGWGLRSGRRARRSAVP